MRKETFGDRLKHVRSHLELSQDKISQLLKISQHTYSNYETNKVAPDIVFIRKVKELSKVNLDWLISGNGEPFQESFFSISNDPKLIDFLFWLKKYDIVQNTALTSLSMLKIKYPDLFKNDIKGSAKTNEDNTSNLDGANIKDVLSEV